MKLQLRYSLVCLCVLAICWFEAKAQIDPVAKVIRAILKKANYNLNEMPPGASPLGTNLNFIGG